MSAHTETHDNGSAGPPTNGRQAAHERLATGALARWARMCATRPWRVLAGWLVIRLVPRKDWLIEGMDWIKSAVSARRTLQ